MSVQNILNRLGLTRYGNALREEQLDKVVSLRTLSDEKMAQLIPNESDRQKLQEFLKKNTPEGPPPGPPPRYDEALSGPSQTASQPREGGDRVKICKYFNTTEGCKKGDACNLAHIDGPKGPSVERRERNKDTNNTDATRTEGQGPRPRRICRDFTNGFCKFASSCRFLHETSDGVEVPSGQTADGQPTSVTNPFRAPRQHNSGYFEEITVPADRVKNLLANKAEKIMQIHKKNGTSNPRMAKPEVYHATHTFQIFGTPEAVKATKEEIDLIVGITRQHEMEARFNYAQNEMKRNLTACNFLLAANIKNAGSPFELSEKSVQSIVSTFRFNEPHVSHFSIASPPQDKDKFEIIQQIVKHLQGVQGLVFVEAARVAEMQKRVQFANTSFGVRTTNFAHPGMPKEERMKALESFKAGEANEQGVIQRLLITSNDYAKLARKISIPYVNLVVHFNVPKTKELYLHQAMCAGRNGKNGISILFYSPSYDLSTMTEWNQSIPFQELKTDSLHEIAAVTSTLQYDTSAVSLNPADADPPANWREQIAAPKK